jgi:hypothetical protein
MKKMKKLIILAVVFMSVPLLHAAGVLESHSGNFKNFSYRDGSITRNARAEYIGQYWKTFYIEGSGRNAVIVAAANFMPWNSHEYAGWEELTREPYPYANNDTIRRE